MRFPSRATGIDRLKHEYIGGAAQIGPTGESERGESAMVWHLQGVMLGEGSRGCSRRAGGEREG